EHVKSISKGDPEIESFINMLLVHIGTLEARVRDLERQLGQNSNNSSKPPSSDGFRRPTNLRKSGGKNGAPNGHTGYTLHFTDKPGDVILHHPTACTTRLTPLEVSPTGDNIKQRIVGHTPPCVVVCEQRAKRARSSGSRDLQHA